MPQFETTNLGYARMWDGCKVRENRVADAGHIADRILKNKAAYQSIEASTGVPWPFIGVIHIRESDGDMKTHLHNGDSLQDYTHQEPPGRPKVGHGPPFTWTESAIDALLYEGFGKLRGQWNIELMLFEEELYNGWGYFNKDENTPYVWSWTLWYTSGKYIRDRVYSETAVDAQPGTAAMMKALADKDSDARQIISKRYMGKGVPPGAVTRHTSKERNATTAGTAGAATGATGTSIEKPASPGGKVAMTFVSVAIGTIGLGVALVAGVLLYRKAQVIKARWLGVGT